MLVTVLVASVVAVTVATRLPSAEGADAATSTDRADPSLPSCAIADLPAIVVPAGDGRWTVLDLVHALPAQWEPDDLVSLREAGFDDDRSIRSAVVPDLRALVAAAASEGVYFEVQSAYRSYAYQEATFARWVDLQGFETAVATSARPGHSEHQLGTAVDLRTAGGPAPWDLADWSATREGAWMARNGPSFGFVMSYPSGASHVTCYDFEPWHWRWVGRDMATAVVASGSTLREYLWTVRHAPSSGVPEMP